MENIDNLILPLRAHLGLVDGMHLVLIVATTFANNGSRICPGRYLAVHSVWLAMAYTLTLYAVSPATDENGIKIELKRENFSGLTMYVLYPVRPMISHFFLVTGRHPKPFRIQLTPRSKDMANLINVLKDDESFAC